MLRILALMATTLPAIAAERDYPPLPKPVTSFGATVADGHVYLYGGHSGKAHNYSTETTLGQLIRLDIANPKKWEELASGPIAQGVALVAYDGKLYRIGGMQPRNGRTEKSDLRSLDSASRFDPKTGKWEDLPAMPSGRSSHDAVVVGDTIYVFGGWTMNGPGKENDWLTTGLALDLKKQPLKWESIEQPYKRRALTMAALDGKVYVIAGLNSEGKTERSVDVYDPAKKTWSKTTEIPGDEMNGFTPAACVCDGKLYVNPADGKLYRLTDKASWEEAGAVKTPRIVHRVVPFGKNRMLVLGGNSKGSITGVVEDVAPSR